MNSKASNFKKQAGWIIALGVAAIAVILGFSSLFGAGSDAATKKQVWVKVSPDGLTYTPPHQAFDHRGRELEIPFQKRRRLRRPPSSGTAAGPARATTPSATTPEGNPVYVVYGSNEFRLEKRRPGRGQLGHPALSHLLQCLADRRQLDAGRPAARMGGDSLSRRRNRRAMKMAHATTLKTNPATATTMGWTKTKPLRNLIQKRTRETTLEYIKLETQS